MKYGIKASYAQQITKLSGPKDSKTVISSIKLSCSRWTSGKFYW